MFTVWFGGSVVWIPGFYPEGSAPSAGTVSCLPVLINYGAINIKCAHELSSI